MVGVALAVGGLFALTLMWWHPGIPLSFKLRGTGAVLAACVTLLLLTPQVTGSIDLTEDQRHSFNPVVRAALQQIQEPLRITTYLLPEDPRMMDFNRSVLAKLRRALPGVTIMNPEADQTAIFRTGDDPNYGLIVYEIGSRRQESRSTSPEEVLPLLWDLGRVSPPKADDPPAYPGYPLVVSSLRSAVLVFYFLWPTLSLLGLLRYSRR